jgi:hypothetical protein
MGEENAVPQFRQRNDAHADPFGTGFGQPDLKRSHAIQLIYDPIGVNQVGQPAHGSKEWREPFSRAS